jgi:1,4-dihydroxy-2-naphthoate octaprenyltransferase
LAVGALSTALLVVNNLRDVETDAKAGKRTLVVRAGVRAGRAEYVGALALAFVAPIVLWLGHWVPTTALLALLALPVAISPVRIVLFSSGKALNAAIGGTARLLAVFGILLCAGLALGGR